MSKAQTSMSDGKIATKRTTPRMSRPPSPPVIGLYDVAARKAYRFNPSQRVITLGRGRTSDILVFGTTVSMRHCEIVRVDDGRYVVQDNDSVNGTWINYLPVQRCELAPGMRIHLGKAELFVLGSDPKIPLTAKTLDSFYAEAARVYGSVHTAARQINKSASTISRGERRRRARLGA